MAPVLSHVAVLVPSVRAAAARCQAEGWELGPIEEFPGEGTREVYVGPPGSEGRLLFMEAIGPGPYRRALEKRGPGLHHVAVDVASLDDLVASLAGAGWLLHPASLGTLARKTVYLARPGLGALIEVQAVEALEPGRPRFVAEVSIAGAREHQPRVDALGVPGLGLAERAEVVVAGKRIAIADLARG